MRRSDNLLGPKLKNVGGTTMGHDLRLVLDTNYAGLSLPSDRDHAAFFRHTHNPIKPSKSDFCRGWAFERLTHDDLHFTGKDELFRRIHVALPSAS